MKMRFEIGILILVGFIITNCGLNKLSQQASNEIDHAVVSGELVRYIVGLNKVDSSISSLSYQYYTTKFPDVKNTVGQYKDSVNLKICDFIQTTTVFEKLEDECILSHQFFSAQLDSFAHIYFDQEDENSIVWSIDASIRIEDYFDDFVALTLWGWSYTGGAHGNSHVAFEMIAKSDGRLLELTDFITDSEELNAIAEPIFREANELQPNESLNDAGYWFTDNKFSVNDNFYFADEMMVFYYNTYEIAPYSGGPTELKVPIAKIKHLLKQKI